MVSDLDRTLTGADLVIDDRAIERMRALRRIGIRVVIATGRRFDDPQVGRLLRHVDGMVAENGAVLCVPAENALEVTHSHFAEAAQRALGDLSRHFEWGRVLGSAPRELADDVATVLTRADLAHHMEFNAEHVMLLPKGVDKAWGADRCLRKLEIAVEQVWAIGDGENDAALLRWASLGAAPGNAAPAAAEAADVRLLSSYADAFLELTERLVREEVAPAP